MLLWTCRIHNIGNLKQYAGKNASGDEYKQLELSKFWFPIKYCQILNELIIDPTAQEEEASNF